MRCNNTVNLPGYCGLRYRAEAESSYSIYRVFNTMNAIRTVQDQWSNPYRGLEVQLPSPRDSPRRGPWYHHKYIMMGKALHGFYVLLCEG